MRSSDFNNGFAHPANRVDDELYRDVVEKFGGDHQRALEALERLGMVTPPHRCAASPSQLSTSAADDIYRDLLARSQGDHALAHAALRQLNLDLSQPRHSSHGGSGLHSPQPTTTVCGESSLHLRTVETATSLEQYTQGTTGWMPSTAGSASAPASAYHGVDDMFATERAPPFYVCPVSGIVMRDPVVLSSGRSYERRAIEHQLGLQPNICPASRRPLESPVVLTPDHDLRANVQAWCAANAPQLLDADGNLLPAKFHVGIEHHIAWVQDRLAASAMAALPQCPPPSRVATTPTSCFDSPTATELADSRLARQLQEDERRKGGHSIVHTSGPGHSGGGHKREPPPQLDATRLRVALFGWTAAAVVLAWVATFLWELSENGWGFVNISVNPWIGVSVDALLSSGGTCSPCIADDREWWRLLASLLLSAGVTQLLLNSAMLALWSHVCAHLGVPTLVYVAILAVAGVAASFVSAAAVQETVHTVSAAVPAAAMGIALAGTAAWGASMRRGWLTAAVLLLCLASQVVVSLAPFADAWATVAGFVVGGLCALVFFVPNMCTVGGVPNKRLVLFWQALLTGLVIVVYIITIVAVLRSPEEGPRCPTCSSMSCADMLDWSCAEARHNYGVCDFSAFANSTLGLTCPGDQRRSRTSVYAAGPMTTEQLDTWCSQACPPGATAPPPPSRRGGRLAPPSPPLQNFAT